MSDWYGEDLAHVHDVGFGGYALGSAPGILEVLEKSGMRGGLVVDLGCGSGLWARRLVDAGYRVLGVDVSEAMVEIARERVPEAEFRVGSLFDTDVPPCAAVTAVGEVLNYLFDPRAGEPLLDGLFLRLHGALVPGGVFVFDVAEPGQAPAGGVPARSFSEGDGWAVLVEKQEDAEKRILSRRIVTFRRMGEAYRRSEETHRLRLYEAAELERALRRAGFSVEVSRGYGGYGLPPAHSAFVASKAG